MLLPHNCTTNRSVRQATLLFLHFFVFFSRGELLEVDFSVFFAHNFGILIPYYGVTPLTMDFFDGSKETHPFNEAIF